LCKLVRRGAHYRFRIIVTSELPGTPDTLFLRALGAGKTLRRAQRELRANGADHPVTRIVTPLMVRLHLSPAGGRAWTCILVPATA
jgi:hypothetical protein